PGLWTQFSSFPTFYIKESKSTKLAFPVSLLKVLPQQTLHGSVLLHSEYNCPTFGLIHLNGASLKFCPVVVMFQPSLNSFFSFHLFESGRRRTPSSLVLHLQFEEHSHHQGLFSPTSTLRLKLIDDMRDNQ
ncbi:hypothetical protein XENORESO_020761, partial [Xenotaenia resolanae]